MRNSLTCPTTPTTTIPSLSVWPLITCNFLAGELEKPLPFFQPLTPPGHPRNSEKSKSSIFPGEECSGEKKSKTSCSDTWCELKDNEEIRVGLVKDQSPAQGVAAPGKSPLPSDPKALRLTLHHFTLRPWACLQFCMKALWAETGLGQTVCLLSTHNQGPMGTALE